MVRKKNAAAPADTAPTTEQWRRLYNVAAELKSLAPWRILYDTDIITIQLPDQEEPVFCCVMGHAETCYGVAVYSGCEGFIGLSRLISADGSEADSMGAFEQKCLACYFGDREEVVPEDRAVMQALELKFRRRGQWIYFRAMEPGHGRPAAVYVRAAQVADYLEHTCKKLGISLVVGEAMPSMDELIEGILCLWDV